MRTSSTKSVATPPSIPVRSFPGSPRYHRRAAAPCFKDVLVNKLATSKAFDRTDCLLDSSDS
eukprot:scaffold1724_cov341-Pavlova_lutheri.AAC.35